MMDKDIAVEVKNLSKSYRLYEKPSGRLKEVLLHSSKVKCSEHYALKELSFVVNKGETFGIIGDNGAGKSTLLKLITGVTRATSGSININGKVSALLELGAGFNKEYTGIENIYLNGSMMGFADKDMSKKVEEILSFADIGEYAYQKVKTYSSGMFARLAFAVAINVEPEILIVDEALSVGDVFFQNKCFKKFDELREKGVTILFVSHDIHSVKQMCSRALWLEGGRPRMLGDSVTVCNSYTNSVYQKNNGGNSAFIGIQDVSEENYDENILPLEHYPDIHYTEESILHDQVKIISCYIVDEKQKIVTECEINREYQVNLIFRSDINIDKCIAGFVLETKKGVWMINSNSAMCGKKKPVAVKANTVNKVSFSFKLPAFMKGEYVVGCAISDGTMDNYKVLTWLYNVLAITIVNEGNNSGMVDVETDITWYSKKEEEYE